MCISSTLFGLARFVYEYDGDAMKLTGSTREYPRQFESYEQLWLAFYMHTAHGLIWREGWVDGLNDQG